MNLNSLHIPTMHLYKAGTTGARSEEVNLMHIHFWCRPARFEGAGARGGHAEPAHHLPQRPRFGLWFRIFASQLSVQTSGEAARAQDSVHTRPPTYLLPETRRHGPAASDRGQNIHGHSPVLRRGIGASLRCCRRRAKD